MAKPWASSDDVVRMQYVCETFHTVVTRVTVCSVEIEEWKHEMIALVLYLKWGIPIATVTVVILTEIAWT